MSRGTGSHDVLYVAERERIRTLVREYFEDVTDAALLTAATAEEAIEVVDRQSVDCVVSDHAPPNVHAFDLLDRLHELEPRTPFILFPSAGDERLAAEALEREVDAYLPNDLTFAEFGALATQVRQAIEKVETERELAATRARFRALTENTSVAVVSIDDSSTIRYANDGVEEVFGYAPDELVGESLLELVPERLHEDHLEGIARYLDRGERRLDWEWVELPGSHKRGHEVPLGITFGEATIDGEPLFTGVIRRRAADGAGDEPVDAAPMEPRH